MRPLLRENDTQVVIEPLRRPAKKGDILLYDSRTGFPVLHRAIAVAENTVTLRGDNELSTETVPFEKIAGLATEIYRHGRHYFTDGWEMRSYAVLITGLYPVRRTARVLRRHLADTLPRPFVNAVRKIIHKYRK